jgi:hypothetical protein
MGDNNQSTFPGNDPAAYPPDAAALDKGKGKAVEDPMDVSMDEDDDDSESEAEEQVCCCNLELKRDHANLHHPT